jgi:hypothetical protein
MQSRLLDLPDHDHVAFVITYHMYLHGLVCDYIIVPIPVGFHHLDDSRITGIIEAD